jgi:hypothetical protein
MPPASWPNRLHLLRLSILILELLPLSDIEMTADHVGLSADPVAKDDAARVNPR